MGNHRSAMTPKSALVVYMPEGTNKNSGAVVRNVEKDSKLLEPIFIIAILRKRLHQQCLKFKIFKSYTIFLSHNEPTIPGTDPEIFKEWAYDSESQLHRREAISANHSKSPVCRKSHFPRQIYFCSFTLTVCVNLHPQLVNARLIP